MVSERHLIRFAPFALLVATACGPSDARFPLRDPLWHDTDLRPVTTRCHAEPTPKERNHVSCAPESYDGTLYWDGIDSLLLRPLSEAVGLATSGESTNVNGLDEVPDSAWFTNRLGARLMSAAELRQNACPTEKLLDPQHATDGAWLIDKGKTSGSTAGFRINVPGKGKYLVKLEVRGPERQGAATVVGEAVFYAAGYYASCEQLLYVRPSIFKLAPDLLAAKGNFGDVYPFDRKALDELIASATMRAGLVRITASAWLPGFPIGQFRYEGTRSDDPNDVIPHQNRRELRGARVLAAWIDHFDSREGNSFDTWISDSKGGPPDSSPGHVLHYQIGTSAALGSSWDWDDITRRLGYSYIIDWHDAAVDFVTLGAVPRIWDRVQKVPGHEIFGYFNVADFDPDGWKNEYSNAAFSRMTERDGAWMARILARFTPEMVRTLAEMGQFSDVANTDYLESVLQGRLSKILERYLTRLSSIADLRVEGRERLCGVDLAEWRGLRDASQFRYTARTAHGPWLSVERGAGGRVCVTLTHGRIGDYVRLLVRDGVSAGPLVAHLYDLGPEAGYRLVGLERPDR